ncbi:hypothetical protein GOB93_03405 [Acetobacter musti]|uniref:Uncharacterized protein n=1 Tax=Acetobacter musti TaxID=864732 RepID=A0ABX0JKB8_9PROT|nr:hypothetical protein [Acetobacter musti]NHN83687.1 hypothetical protein [Acetobacter musti]
MTDDELNHLADKIALAVADELDKRDKPKKQAEIARQQQQGRLESPYTAQDEAVAKAAYKRLFS